MFLHFIFPQNEFSIRAAVKWNVRNHRMMQNPRKNYSHAYRDSLIRFLARILVVYFISQNKPEDPMAQKRRHSKEIHKILCSLFHAHRKSCVVLSIYLHVGIHKVFSSFCCQILKRKDWRH